MILILKNAINHLCLARSCVVAMATVCTAISLDDGSARRGQFFEIVIPMHVQCYSVCNLFVFKFTHIPRYQCFVPRGERFAQERKEGRKEGWGREGNQLQAVAW